MRIPIKAFKDDPSLSWEERFRLLESHHQEETQWMIDEIKRLEKEDRWCFMKDDDGHDYLIPSDLREEFDQLLFGNDDEHAKFIDKFDQHRIGYHLNWFSFTNPKCDK